MLAMKGFLFGNKKKKKRADINLCVCILIVFDRRDDGRLEDRKSCASMLRAGRQVDSRYHASMPPWTLALSHASHVAAWAWKGCRDTTAQRSPRIDVYCVQLRISYLVL